MPTFSVMLSFRADASLDNSCETIHLRHEAMTKKIHRCSLLGALPRGEQPIRLGPPPLNSVASLQQCRPPIRISSCSIWPLVDAYITVSASILTTIDIIHLMRITLRKTLTYCAI